MMEGLHIGRSGMMAAQRGLEVASHNIANVNTPGYTRQRIEQAAAAPRSGDRGVGGPGASGSGVVITGVTRLRDNLLDLSFRDAVGEASGWQTRADFLQRAEEVLGSVDGGVPEALDRYWNSWERLSLTPQDASAREGVLAAGRNLAQLVNSASNQLSALQVEVTGRSRQMVDEVNRLAADVAQLNRGIQEAQARGDSPTDMLDARDMKFDRLAELVGARVILHQDGSSSVSLNGLPLVDGGRSFALAQDPGPPLAVRWQADNRPAVVRGELGAALELSTTTLVSLSTELDRFATDLISVVNTAHAGGRDLDDNPGGTFFIGAGAADFAVDPALGYRSVAASAGGGAADGNHALVMGDLREAPLSGGESAGRTLGTFASRLGLLADEAIRNRDSARTVANSIDRQRMTAGAVSLDEELTDMLRYQRAFEAAARVVTVIDDMLNKLINGTGVTR